MKVSFLFGLFIIALCQNEVQAKAETKEKCKECIVRHEKQKGLEPGLLQAIVQVESKMSPYAVNAAGRSHKFSSAAEAARFVEEKQRQGVRNISVGLTQLHVPSHRGKFKSLEDMMDLEKNVSYAASMIKRLKRQTGSIEEAVKTYHSPAPKARERYKSHVFGIWGRIRLRNGDWDRYSNGTQGVFKGLSKASYRNIFSSDEAKLRLAMLKQSVQPKATDQVDEKKAKGKSKSKKKSIRPEDLYALCSKQSCDNLNNYHKSRWDHQEKLDRVLLNKIDGVRGSA